MSRPIVSIEDTRRVVRAATKTNLARMTRPSGAIGTAWRRRILLVEGSEPDAQGVTALIGCIEGWSSEVVRARSIADARALLAVHAFDAVLLGGTLPDGEEVDAVVAISVAVPELPIVALTNRGGAERGLEAVQRGAQDYLDKSKIDAAALGQALRYAIERKRAEARLVYLAHYDQLTGLANRALFYERLEQALQNAPKHRARVAVMFLDLDRFKAINDTRGHDAGDALLQQVASRLSDCVRQGETVARLGGDEFTVLLEGVRRLDDATVVAQRIIDAFEAPFDVSGRSMTMSTSVGVAISAENVRTADLMLERADRAMYRAKQQGRNRFEVSQDEPDISTGDLFDTTCEVERALATGELDVWYQPKVQVVDGRLIGMEALLRWNHPRHGLMSPARFIPLMEQSGMIGEVGRWVLETAMRQMKSWLDEGFGDFRVAVNVSAQQLEDPRFVDTVAQLLDETGLPARNLELEITESMLIEQSTRSHHVLEALQRLGVRLAMDDFGTGYSSLSYLVNYPIDILKIDKSFVAELLTSPRHRAIVTAIVGLGRSLDLEIVAEGVETVEQLESLRDMGCRSIQGFLLSQPQASSDIEGWLDDRTEIDHERNR